MEKNQQLLKTILQSYLPPCEITYAETEYKKIAGLDFFISGVSVLLDSGIIAMGSSCSMDSDPLVYAGYECIERFIVQTKISPSFESENCKFSISNGVALHSNEQKAKNYALYELIERDTILKSWYYNQPIKRLTNYEFKIFPKDFTDIYDVYIILFGVNNLCIVTGIFAFPKNETDLFIYGFGCEESLEASLDKSKKEFLMRMGFLWNETSDITAHSRKSNLYHQDFYLVPTNMVIIRDWLDSTQTNNLYISSYSKDDYCLNNLSSPKWKDELFIYQATSEKTIPLFFGVPPKEYFQFPYRCDIPHPIA